MPVLKTASHDAGRVRGLNCPRDKGGSRGTTPSQGQWAGSGVESNTARTDASYDPKKKLILKLTTRTNETESLGRGLRTRKSTKFFEEAMSSLKNDGNNSQNDVSAQPVSANVSAEAVAPGYDNVILSGTVVGAKGHSAARNGSFETSEEGVNEIFQSLRDDGIIRGSLPNFTRTENDPEFGTVAVTAPWTSRKLFHLYLLAYANREPHICDLVADTWIHAFQNMDADPERKIWKENRSEFKKQRDKAAPAEYRKMAAINNRVTSFNFDLLAELYQFTKQNCGARLLWGDAMALCGGWLDERMGNEYNTMYKWPQELMWDVLRSSLRLSRVRRTLKIEENDPKEWCKRYHEHHKHDLPCYQDLAKAQTARGLDGDSMVIDSEEDGVVDARRVKFTVPSQCV